MWNPCREGTGTGTGVLQGGMAHSLETVNSFCTDVQLGSRFQLHAEKVSQLFLPAALAVGRGLGGCRMDGLLLLP